MSQIIKFPCTNVVVPISYIQILRLFYCHCVYFMCSFCSCARSSRSDFCRAMEFRYFRRRVGSGRYCRTFLSKQCGIRMPQKNIYMFRGIQCSVYMDWKRKGSRVCFVVFGTNNILKNAVILVTATSFFHRIVLITELFKSIVYIKPII